MSLANALIASCVEFCNQILFSLNVVGGHFVNPVGRAFSGDTGVIPVQVVKEAGSDIATPNVDPLRRIKQAIDPILVGSYRLNVLAGEHS